MLGIINEISKIINTKEKTSANIGIIITFAIIEIIFKFLKNTAFIINKASNVEIVNDKDSANFCGVLILIKAVLIGLLNKTMPKAQPKLIKKLTSNTHNGFNKKQTMPATPIEFNGSYSLPIAIANKAIADMIDARTTDELKSQT